MNQLPVRMPFCRAEVCGADEAVKLGKPTTLSEYIVALVGANPSGVFVEIGFDGIERSRTYGELFEEARKLAGKIKKFWSGGDQIALLCFETVAEYIPAAWACLLNGFSFFPLSVSQLSRSRDAFFQRARQATEILGKPLILTEARFEEFLVGMGLHVHVFDTRSLLALPVDPEDCDAAAAGPSDILIETSGTTGTSRIARLGGDKIINRFFDGVGVDQRVGLNLLVHYSVGGLRLLLPLGRRTIYLDPARMMANPTAWLDCVTRFGVTDAGMSSAMAAKINESIERGASGWRASSLERLAFGSETITPSIIRSLISNLQSIGMGDVTASLVYSMTETGPLFSSRLPVSNLLDGNLETEGQFRLNRCADSWRVRIVSDNGDIAPMGKTGRIFVRSETRLFRGYYPSGEGVNEDGWFDTGDLGSLNEQGLVITGRDKATICINARKICSEDVERCLSQISGLKPGGVFAAPIRTEDNSTDELAVFFTLQPSHDLARLVPNMQSAVSKALGIRISHLVPIEEDQIERTATGKLKRNALVEGLRLGRWKTLRAKPNRWYDYTEGLSWLKEQWKEILELEFEPGGDENFFDLGGDSLACAQLLFAVEEKYHCRLSLDAFFDNPTPSNMGELVRAATPQAGRTWKHDEEPSDQSSLLRKLQTFTASWRGRRFFSDSMIVGFNVDGHRPPIFWILQKYDEASQLAKHLGPDQPLYAMRSCVGIIEGAIYTPEVMEAIGNRYLWEMLAVQIDDSFILGGTCQGGVLALGLARRLRQIGRPPIVLALLEWNFSLGSYAEPALLIYGEESFTADVYLRPDTAAIKWREDFPQSAVVSVPGVHEDVARSDVSIAALAKILKAQNEGYVTLSPMDGKALRRLGTALAIREAEATEYRAQLKSTAGELKKLKASRSWRVTAPFRSLAATLARLRAW